jgi:hypothetical protein
MPSNTLQVVLQKLMEQVLTHILHQVTLMSIPWCLAKDCRRWIPANIGNNAISGSKRWRIPTIDRKRFNRGFSHPIPLSRRRSYEVYERQPSLLASETSVRIPLRTVSLQSLRKDMFLSMFLTQLRILLAAIPGITGLTLPLRCSLIGSLPIPDSATGRTGEAVVETNRPIDYGHCLPVWVQ